MKLSENWIRKFINFSVSTRSIIKIMDTLGMEVKKISKVNICTDNIIVGKIIKIRFHKKYKNLSINIVNIGNNRIIKIFCFKDTDITPGIYVAIEILNFHSKKKNTIFSKHLTRNIKACILPLKYLNINYKKSEFELPKKKFVIGKPINKYFDIQDKIIEIDIFPNRADHLSVIGIAREIASFLKKEIKKSNVSIQLSKISIPKINIRISNVPFRIFYN